MNYLFLFLSIPLILGSIISFFIFLIYPFIISKRIKNEEKVLEKNLKRYKEYKKKVKYKIIGGKNEQGRSGKFIKEI